LQNWVTSNRDISTFADFIREFFTAAVPTAFGVGVCNQVLCAQTAPGTSKKNGWDGPSLYRCDIGFSSPSWYVDFL
jgi:hypothetical protein